MANYKVFKVELQADVVGPLADGTADKALEKWAEDTSAALAKDGVKLLKDFPMNKSGRADGAFQAALHVLQDGPVARIPGPQFEGITWSPWLEGTSKRNESTHFKGYHLFRKARQELQKRAPEVGQRELDKIMPELGGAP